MKISIKVITKKTKIIYGIPSLKGEIQIGDFKETFVMPLEYWSLEDYEKQWRNGLERIKNHETSCLVATVQDPEKGPLIELWALYKVENKIYVRNYLYVAEWYKKLIGNNVFKPENCYKFIGLRDTRSKGGRSASEWVVDFD